MNTTETWVSIVFYLLWFYFTAHEFIQFYSDRLDYVFDFTNYFDIASSLINIYLVTNHQYQFSPLSTENLYSLTAIATLLLWVKGLLWLRLFSATSFYIRLIIETLKDITYFMIILMIFLVMFANCLYILDLYREEVDPDLVLVEGYFDGWNTLNTLFN